MAEGRCRLCAAPLEHVFADLGSSPLANSFLAPEELRTTEPSYPLRAFVCARCLLVQLEEYAPPEAIFRDYAYYSSYSTSWLDHARAYVDEVAARFGLDERTTVIEIGSNDGYLLRNFVAREIPALGIDPAANVARVAVRQGVPTLVDFFGTRVARALRVDTSADLLIANNVLAHVADLHDFVAGMRLLLAPGGVVTIEHPHLLALIEGGQFDTIYHEHFSYFSLSTAKAALEQHGLRIFDVDKLPTHGGSLRLFACHMDDPRSQEPSVDAMLACERAAKLDRLTTYGEFAKCVAAERRAILALLTDLKRDGCAIAAYGAPAKGNTLLNYCGIGTDLISYTVDLNPYKQGRFLPGSRIPVYPPEAIRETRPDVVFILPWNLRDEIVEQLAYVRDWGGRFAVRAPELRLV
jgi:SAM-dependent methyltransferase